jgi:hypothetical protein
MDKRAAGLKEYCTVLPKRRSMIYRKDADKQKALLQGQPSFTLLGNFAL